MLSFSMSGFDEFPQPISANDVRLLDREGQRLQHAFRKLHNALNYYHRASETCVKNVQAVARSRQLLTAAASDLSLKREVGRGDGASDLKRPREDDSTTKVEHADVPDPQVQQQPPSTRRRFVQSAALLAGMKKLIAANEKKDAADGSACVREQRERIAREAQLRSLDDQAIYAEQQLTEAQRAVTELTVKLEQVRPRLSHVNRALRRMEVMEPTYVALFFLRAASNVHEDTSADHAVDHVFVAPSVHTDATRDMVRLQVNSGLDAYLAYRAEVDPLVADLKQRVALREKQEPISYQPMSAEEASVILRQSSANTELAAAAPTTGGGAAAAPDAVQWAIYEDAVAALDDFE